MFAFLATATIAQRKNSLAAKKAAEKNLVSVDNDYVSAKEYIKGKMNYKMNKADETLSAWKLKKDADNKALKYHAENVEGSLTMQCPTGFEACENAGFHHDHACCAIEERSLFKECPTAAHFYDASCWIPANYETRCPGGYEQKGEKCIKHDATEPEILCPEGFTRVGNTYTCEKEQTVTEERCILPAFRDGEDCVVEEPMSPTCPEGYELLEDQLACKREYTAACDMKVPHTKDQLMVEKYGYKPNLRRLAVADVGFEADFNKNFEFGTQYSGHHGGHHGNYNNGSHQTSAYGAIGGGVGKQFSFDVVDERDFYDHHNHGKDSHSYLEWAKMGEKSAHSHVDKEMHSKEKLEKEHEKQKEMMKMMHDYHTHVEKHIAFEKDLEIEKQKEIQLALDKEMKADFHLAEKALGALPNSHYDKVYKKVVKATCLYEDYAPAVRDIRRRIVDERDVISRDETMRVNSSIVCPAGYMINEIKNQCVLFNEEPVSKICDGVIVAGKCLEEVLPITYCEKPWIQDGQRCIREIYAPGLYTWLRDHSCFGDAKYCTALNKYIEH